MDLGLEDKVALVAAGTSGMALAAAKCLVREGALVSICGRSVERLEAALDELEAVAPGRAAGRSVDVTDASAVRTWVDDCAAARGGLDIVVASSGGPPYGPVPEWGPADYTKAFDTSVMPLIAVAVGALPYLREARDGRLLFISSYLVKHSVPEFALSNAVRPSVVGYAKSLTDALRGTRVTVNVIAPGVVSTPALVGLTDDELAGLVAATPLGRPGRPEEIGELVAFLAGDRCSFMTGSVITVDGGASRGLL